MQLPNKFGCGVPLTIFDLLLHTFQESAMLRQTDNHEYLGLSWSGLQTLKFFQESIHKLGVNPTIELVASHINF